MEMLSVLKNQTYRRLFAAQAISLVGTGLATVALALLAFDLAGDEASRAGIMLTLGGVALATVLGRQQMLLLVGRHGASIDGITRLLEAVAGAILVGIAVQALSGTSW